MWDERKSLALSKISVIVFAVIFLLAAIFAPWIIEWLSSRSANIKKVNPVYLLVTVYSGLVFAAVLLYQLYKVLHNLGKNMVFIEENTARLRKISWCCIAAAGLCFLSAFYYTPWIFISVAAGFMALIVRVVKNVIAEAILIKNENDYTI